MDENYKSEELPEQEENSAVQEENIPVSEDIAPDTREENPAGETETEKETEQSEDTADTEYLPDFEEYEMPEKPPVDLAPVHRLPLNTSRRGMRIFAFALAGVIVLTCALAGGYLWGQSSQKPLIRPKSKISVDLKKTPDSDELSPAELYKKVKNSVVGIQVYNTSNSASASGVIFTKDGYVITNDHIYDGIPSPKFTVYTADGKTHSAVFVAGDTRSDLAVLKINDGKNYSPAVFGDSGGLYIGEPVAAVGCPVSADIPPNLTTGLISMLNRRLSVNSNYALKYIQTNAAFNPGSSGGALLNMYGQVIGITSAKISGEDYEGLFFAIPSADVKNVVESLIKNGYVEGRAKLGISYNEVSAAVSDVYGYSKGLYVAEIAENSDANGKLEVGDIITEINGTKIQTDDTVLNVIEESKPNDVLTITAVTQKGGTKTVKVKLLEDRGSSSYSTAKPDSKIKGNENPSGDNSGGQNDNGNGQDDGGFNFPFGD